VEWFKQPDGSLTLSLGNRETVEIPAPDACGYVQTKTGKRKMQEVLDQWYQILCRDYGNSRYLWDKQAIDRWRTQDATEKQLNQIKRFLGAGFDTSGLTKGDASKLLNRLFAATPQERKRWRS
jgi:hypothetical protein